MLISISLGICNQFFLFAVFNVSVGENQVVTSNLVATLSGHKERVVSIAWNPHQDGMLLSASYDGTAQVWDVINQNPLKNFSLHSGRLLCCEWSALEPNVAITGVIFCF